MGTRHRLAVAALCADFALYLLMLSLPYRLLALDASSSVLGNVPLLYAGPYATVALLAGRVSDRFARRGPIRFGLLLAIAGAVGLARVDTAAAILWSIPPIGIGLGFFWPSLQAGFSEVSAGRDLHRLTGLLNVSWSAGKGLGLLGGGWLLESVGPHGTSLAAAVAFAVALIALPRMGRPGDHSAALADDERAPHVDEQKAFRRAAWIGNGIAFGVVATVNHHLPKVLLPHGIDASSFGTFLGSVFLAQTTLFVVLGPRRGWHFRAAPLLALQLVLAAATLAVPRATSQPALLLFAPVFGLALGFAYQSSLYYSLYAPTDRGARAGVHEAVLGFASAIIPAVGGLAVAGAGTRVPFAIAAAAMLVSAAFGTWTIVRTRRRPVR